MSWVKVLLLLGCSFFLAHSYVVHDGMANLQLSKRVNLTPPPTPVEVPDKWALPPSPEAEDKDSSESTQDSPVAPKPKPAPADAMRVVTASHDMEVRHQCLEGLSIEAGEICIHDDKGHRHLSFRSNLSGKPLSFGKWYHKKGFNVNIREEELKLFTAEEQAKYVRIRNLSDLRAESPESLDPPEIRHFPPPTERKELPQKPLVFAEHTVVTYRSDMSGTPLELGKWYHKIGVDLDITDKEWSKLPSDEKVKYVRIDTKKDLSKVEEEGWVRNKEALMRSSEMGPIGILTEKLKQSAASKARNWASQIRDLVYKEEQWYDNTKRELIQHVPSILEHSDHTFAGIPIESRVLEDQRHKAELRNTESSGVVSAEGYEIRVAAPKSTAHDSHPDHVTSVAAEVPTPPETTYAHVNP